MIKALQSRKRQLVRDSIYDAAIDLFARKGFDQTTVDEVAEAAGISRRSFFRYFESKDDLLAQDAINNGEQICQTVRMCSASLSLFEVVRRAVSAGVSFAENQPRTRQIVEIASRSSSARQAQLSRLMEQEDKLALAFAARMKSASQYQLRPHLISALTWAIINSAVMSWFEGEFRDIQTAAKNAFVTLARLIEEETPDEASSLASSNGKQPSPKVQKRLTKAKRS
jgi:AcrR family transcriptional regulator